MEQSPPRYLDRALHQYLSAGATIVTSTHRLARECRQQFNASQIRRGKIAWESGEILPMTTWVAQYWERTRINLSTVPTLINDIQLHSIWQQIITEDILEHSAKDEPLWHVGATAKAATDAWRLAKHWGIDLDHCRLSPQIDHQSFHRWAEKFAQVTSKNHWLDPPSLIDQLIIALQDNNDTNHNNATPVAADATLNPTDHNPNKLPLSALTGSHHNNSGSLIA